MSNVRQILVCSTTQHCATTFWWMVLFQFPTVTHFVTYMSDPQQIPVCSTRPRWKTTVWIKCHVENTQISKKNCTTNPGMFYDRAVSNNEKSIVCFSQGEPLTSIDSIKPSSMILKGSTPLVSDHPSWLIVSDQSQGVIEYQEKYIIRREKT